MSRVEYHPEVESDIEQAPRRPVQDWMADIRLKEFIREIERVGDRDDYRKVWPDRMAEGGEVSIAGQALGTTYPVTIYTWEREGFVLCLEERLVFGSKPRFRWLACRYGAPAAEVIATARQRATTHWT